MTELRCAASRAMRLARLGAGVGLVLLAAACSSTPDVEDESLTRLPRSPATPDPARTMSTERIDTGVRAAPGTPAHFEATVKDRVFFDLDQYSLDDSARQVLQHQAAWLRSYPGQKILIEGHCDERGTREYNLALGARRANAVRDYLLSLGVSPDRIQTVTFGKERPVVPGSDSQSYLLNRRAVTRVRGTAGS